MPDKKKRIHTPTSTHCDAEAHTHKHATTHARTGVHTQTYDCTCTHPYTYALRQSAKQAYINTKRIKFAIQAKGISRTEQGRTVQQVYHFTVPCHSRQRRQTSVAACLASSGLSRGCAQSSYRSQPGPPRSVAASPRAPWQNPLRRNLGQIWGVVPGEGSSR